MKNKKMFFLFLCLYVGLGLVLLLEIKQEKIYEPSKVDINDVVQSVKENGLMSDTVREKAKKYGVKVYEQDGSIIVYRNANTEIDHLKKTMGMTIMAILFVLLLVNGWYAWYLDRTMIHPFEELKAFTRHVAAGNLDMPLKKDKANAFGQFTESFDLMREQLVKARENERRTSESKKELIASLSHDIKTPLASIKAMAELLVVTNKDEKQKGKLTSICEKADHIQVLVNNLLHSTLEELNELKVETTEYMSTGLIEMMKEADDQNRIENISMEECLIYCDSIRVQQVFDNIISNSYKYANTIIEVESYIEEGYLWLEIRDYGSGVSEVERLLVLKKYYRGKNAEGKSGTGIGLFISHLLMQKMQGDLEILPSKQGFVVQLKFKLV